MGYYFLQIMRYFYKKPNVYSNAYGKTYTCNHPLYSKCTLFQYENRALAVVQQRFDPKTKHVWWDEIDPWLATDIYLMPQFKEILRQEAAFVDENGLYPTITIRKLMWRLRIKPLKKEYWEVALDTR